LVDRPTVTAAHAMICRDEATDQFVLRSGSTACHYIYTAAANRQPSSLWWVVNTSRTALAASLSRDLSRRHRHRRLLNADGSRDTAMAAPRRASRGRRLRPTVWSHESRGSSRFESSRVGRADAACRTRYRAHGGRGRVLEGAGVDPGSARHARHSLPRVTNRTST